MASSGAQAALKGYRLQALYALSRLLDGHEGHVFQPEGREDLALFGPGGELLEATQVKAYDDNVTLSSFKPRNKDSFFRRVLERQAAHRGTRERIVSFGPFGPQMTAAWAGEGKERTEAVSYFVDAGYVPNDRRPGQTFTGEPLTSGSPGRTLRSLPVIRLSARSSTLAGTGRV